MITLRRNNDRHCERHGKQQTWRSFQPADQLGPSADCFGILELLNESRLPPGAVGPRTARRDAEVITYVREGALAYEDSQGHSGVLHAGEFESMTVRRDTRHSETNASRTDWAQIFQIWLHSAEPGLESSREQRRFSVADRKRELCVVASLGTHRGALRVHQDATVHSTILSPGQHLVHEIAAGRSVWLHVVHGELALLSDVLTTGDGAGIYSERTVSLTARADSEILLLNLAGHPLVAPHR